MEENKKSFSVLTVIITVAATTIIIVLCFLYYYYAVTPIPEPEFLDITENSAKTTEITENPALPELPAELSAEDSTNLIFYISPAILPSETKEGKCLANSAAQPYRQDAWKCAAGNQTYDPCFTAQENKVVCQMNPLIDSAIFLINLTEPLPEPSIPKEIKDNWAWFIEFEDGTYCAPYTGAKPQVQTEEIYYGCKSNVKGQTIVILGELNKGVKWTARKAILLKEGQKTTIKSTEELDVKTVWQ